MVETWWVTPDGGLEYYQHADDRAGVRWSPFRCNEVMRDRPWDRVESFYDRLAAGEASLNDLETLSPIKPQSTNAADQDLRQGKLSDGSRGPDLNQCTVGSRPGFCSDALDGCEVVGQTSDGLENFEQRSDGPETFGQRSNSLETSRQTSDRLESFGLSDAPDSRCGLPRDTGEDSEQVTLLDGPGGLGSYHADRSDGQEATVERKPETGESQRMESEGLGSDSDGRDASLGKETAGVPQWGGSDGQGGGSDGHGALLERESPRGLQTDGSELPDDCEETAGCGSSLKRLRGFVSDGGEPLEDRKATVGSARGSDETREVESDGGESPDACETTVGHGRGLDGSRAAELDGGDLLEGSEPTVGCGRGSTSARAAESDGGDSPYGSEPTVGCTGGSERQLERRNFKVQLAYSGRHFWGWQKQTGHETVQDALERALQSVLDKRETRTALAPERYPSESSTVEAVQVGVDENGQPSTRPEGPEGPEETEGRNCGLFSGSCLAESGAATLVGSNNTCHLETRPRGANGDASEEGSWNSSETVGTRRFEIELKAGRNSTEDGMGTGGLEPIGFLRSGTERKLVEENEIDETSGTAETNGAGRNGMERNGLLESEVNITSGMELNGEERNEAERKRAERKPLERDGLPEEKGADGSKGTKRNGRRGLGTEAERGVRSLSGTDERILDMSGTELQGDADVEGTARNGTGRNGTGIVSTEKKPFDEREPQTSRSGRSPLHRLNGTDLLETEPNRKPGTQGGPLGRAVKKKRYARKKAPVETTNASVAGRTDRGVSAAGQVVSWYTRYMDVDSDEIADAINQEAPGKLRAVHVSLVGRSFHAQFSAKYRSYVYLFPLQGGELLPDGSLRLLPPGKAAPHQPRGTVNVIAPSVVPVTSLDEMLRQLEGRSISYGSYARDTRKDRSSGQPVVCHVFKARADVVMLTSPEGAPSEQKHALRFSLVGNRFLHRMVRVIVATTIREAAAGSPLDALVRLASLECRRATAPPAPPQGLTLAEVGYADYLSA